MLYHCFTSNLKKMLYLSKRHKYSRVISEIVRPYCVLVISIHPSSLPLLSFFVWQKIIMSFSWQRKCCHQLDSDGQKNQPHFVMGKTIRASRLFYIHEYGCQSLFYGCYLPMIEKRKCLNKEFHCWSQFHILPIMIFQDEPHFNLYTLVWPISE